MAIDNGSGKNQKSYVDPREMIALEEELHALKVEQGIEEKTRWWVCLGDRLAERADHQKVTVNRKHYIHLAIGCGWLCGAHRFYSRQKMLGILYTLFCWTGIPFAMTLIDLMIVLPMKEDERGMIEI